MKRRMKQMMAIGLAVMLVFGGCGKQPEEPAVEETIVVEETEPEEAEKEQKEEKMSNSKQSEAVEIHVDSKRKNYYFEGTEESYLYLQYCDIAVNGGENENLKRNIENWSMEQNEYLRSQAAFFESYAAEEKKEGKEYFNTYSLLQDVMTVRNDGSVVSLREDLYCYLGGDHGTFYREGINFDAKSGKRLAFSEIFTDYENFKADATDRIIYQLEQNYSEVLFEDYAEIVETMWSDDMGPRWYFDASGIVLVLEQYLVGPHSIGTPEIYLPYGEIRQYIKDAYLPQEQNGIALFRQNQEVYLTLPGETEETSMMLRSELKNEMMYNSLWLGQEEFMLQDYVAVQNAYIVRCDGEIYCLVEVDEASDDYKTYIFRLTEGKLEKIEEIYAGIDENNVNVHEIIIEETIYLLGTYHGLKNYRFDENGKFVTEDTEYLLAKNEMVLTTKTDIPVILEEMESILPAGSHIVLTATDNETYVKFSIQETGQQGMMLVERNENDYYQITINGINENDCFEMLPYAG